MTLKGKKKKKIVSAIITVLLTVLTILCLTVVIGSLVNDDPSLFGFRCFYVVSGSMEPTVHEGALVITRRSDDGTYNVDDVITFESTDPEIAGSPNTHRIVRITEVEGKTYYVTKGDANAEEDSAMVAPKKVYGRVVLSTFSIPWLRTFLDFLMTPYGFLILVVIPIMLVVVSSLKDYIKTYRDALENLKQEAAAAAAGKTVPKSDNDTDDGPDTEGKNDSGNHQGGE